MSTSSTYFFNFSSCAAEKKSNEHGSMGQVMSFFGGGVWALLPKSSIREHDILPRASIAVARAAVAAAVATAIEGLTNFRHELCTTKYYHLFLDFVEKQCRFF
jgi:hypothetical protein